MTSDEMIEFYRSVSREYGNACGFSIEPLLRSHPEQLDDFLHKFADLKAEELAPITDESKERLRQKIFEQFSELLRDRKEQ